MAVGTCAYLGKKAISFTTLSMRGCAFVCNGAASIVGLEAIRRMAVGEEGRRWVDASLIGYNVVELPEALLAGVEIHPFLKNLVFPAVALTLGSLGRVLTVLSNRIDRAVEGPTIKKERHRTEVKGLDAKGPDVVEASVKAKES